MRAPLQTGAILLALLLTSCGGAAAPAASSAAASVKPAASAKPAAAASVSAKPAASGAAQATSPIKIGVILTLTGPQSPVGKDNEDGLKLFLKSIGGKVAGRQIEPVFADDQFKADVGLTKAKELVQNEHVAALMGFIATPVGYAVATWVKDTAHVPMLITSNAGGEGMLTNPKFKSQYLTRWTQSGTEIVDPSADWAAKQGYRKAAIYVDDYAAGIQNADMFASTFIRRGGSIVQEEYPALGSTDFGPHLANLNKDADVIFTFFPGVDGLRFAEQYKNYVGQSKAQVIDSFGVIGAGSNLEQLKDKALGIVSVDVFSDSADDPSTKAFVKAWKAAYPDRRLSHDAAGGYESGQILAAALEKVHGQIENTQQFMNALYGLQIDSAKGPIKLDQNHDIVQDIKVYKIVKQGNDVGQQVLDVYHNVSGTFARSQDEIEHFPWDKMKGKWVGMTKAQLEQTLKAG